LVIGSEFSSNGAVFDMKDNQGSVITYCYNETSSNPNFRYSFYSVTELLKNGTPCCTLNPSVCPLAKGCNQHSMTILSYKEKWTQINTNISSSFSASFQAGNYINCTLPGSNPSFICANISYINELILEPTIISKGNFSFNLRQDSMLVKIGIYQWPFNLTTSGGMRIQILLDIVNDVASGYYFLPQNTEFSNDIEFNTFQGIGWQNFDNDVAAISFSPFAILDSTTPVKVNISGLYNNSIYDNTFYVYIDIPQTFSSSMEYSLNLYLPKVSAQNETVGNTDDSKLSDKSFLDKNKMYIIYAAIGFVVLIILITGFGVCIRKTC